MMKRDNIESVVCNIVNKTVKVVGVPADQWLRVRAEYLQNRNTNETHQSEKHTTVSTNRYQKAKDLFGEKLYT